MGCWCQAIASAILMDVIGYSCREEGKVCNRKCSCATRGFHIPFTVCEVGDESLTQREADGEQYEEQEEGEEDLGKGENEDTH